MNKIAMIAPGYGNHSVGMGKDFYDNFRLFQENFEHASQCLGYNVTRLCFAASNADLLNPVHSYIAQFIYSHTIAQMLREKYNIYPQLVTGYGIGTIGALSAAQVLNFVDSIYIAKKFLEFLTNNKELTNYSSYRISAISIAELKNILIDANLINLKLVSSDSSKSHIISGSTQELIKLTLILKKIRRSIKFQAMGLGHGLGIKNLEFELVLNQFKPYFNKVDFSSSDLLLLSSVNAQNVLLNDKKEVIENELLKAFSLPLNWLKVLRKLNSYDKVIILGPSKIIKQGLEESIDNSKLFFCDNLKEVERLSAKINFQKSMPFNYDLKSISSSINK